MNWFAWMTLASTGALTLAGCREATTTTASTTAAAPTVTASASAAASTLVRIDDASTVCMVNDQYMGSPQIPVAVLGKTYFGCCAMCKQKLETNEAVRTAIDPVSGKRVDKANAVIARNEKGRVLYFEDESNLRRYGMRSTTQ